VWTTFSLDGHARAAAADADACSDFDFDSFFVRRPRQSARPSVRPSESSSSSSLSAAKAGGGECITRGETRRAVKPGVVMRDRCPRDLALRKTTNAMSVRADGFSG